MSGKQATPARRARASGGAAKSEEVRRLADTACGCAVGEQEQGMIKLVELIATETNPAARAGMVSIVKEVAALYTSPNEIKKRAEAIINDAERYDDETRAAISQLLKEVEAGEDDCEDLAKMVARAEQGEEIWDLTQHDTSPAALAAFGALTQSGDRTDQVFAKMTFEEARVIAARLTQYEMNDERIGDLLALMYGLTYSGQNESILLEVEREFMQFTHRARHTMESLVIERLKTGEGVQARIEVNTPANRSSDTVAPTSNV